MRATISGRARCRRRRAQIVGDRLRLRGDVRLDLRLRPRGIRHAELALHGELARERSDVGGVIVQPREGRHVGTRRSRPGVAQVDEVPIIRILATDARQVGTDALRAPLEG